VTSSNYVNCVSPDTAPRGVRKGKTSKGRKPDMGRKGMGRWGDGEMGRSSLLKAELPDSQTPDSTPILNQRCLDSLRRQETVRYSAVRAAGIFFAHPGQQMYDRPAGCD